MRPPVRGFRPQQPRGAADPSATRPAFMNNSGSEPNSPGLAGVANLTDRLLREVRYPLDWGSVMASRRSPVRSRKLSAGIPARGRVLPVFWTQSKGTMHYLDFPSWNVSRSGLPLTLVHSSRNSYRCVALHTAIQRTSRYVRQQPTSLEQEDHDGADCR